MNYSLERADRAWSRRRVDAAHFIIFSILIIANASINCLCAAADVRPLPEAAAYWIMGAAAALVICACRMIARERAGLLVFALLIHSIAWVMMANIVPDICMGIIAQSRSSASFAPQLGIDLAMSAYLTVILPLYWIAVTIHFIVRQIVLGRREWKGQPGNLECGVPPRAKAR